MAGILAASAAPALVLSPGVLMPVRQIWTPYWPMREVFAYDINVDSYHLRYDVLVRGQQFHMDLMISQKEFKERGELYAQDCRKGLEKYVLDRGLYVRDAVPLQLPQGVHARILNG